MVSAETRAATAAAARITPEPAPAVRIDPDALREAELDLILGRHAGAPRRRNRCRVDREEQRREDGDEDHRQQEEAADRD